MEFWRLAPLDGSKALTINTTSSASGGVGCFTFDNFPICNYAFRVGKEVAKVLGGGRSFVSDPFRFARFAEGALYPVSVSPWLWG